MNRKNTITLLIVVLAIYLLSKMRNRQARPDKSIDFDVDPQQTPAVEYPSNFNDIIMTRAGNMMRGECVNPKFVRSDLSGRECAGTQINETRILRLGDQGCEVLLLQQRLNSIENTGDILKPNGQFNCATKRKLMRVVGVPEIALNQFQPDEQTGFNELEAGKELTNYSYMDVDNIKRQRR